jgi:tripartite-type tricarboxylate transporter receptor subunit TctC
MNALYLCITTSLFAPANTHINIINKLPLEIKSILKSPNVLSTLKELVVEIKSSTPKEAKNLLHAEYLRTKDAVKDAVKAAGIQAQ